MNTDGKRGCVRLCDGFCLEFFDWAGTGCGPDLVDYIELVFSCEAAGAGETDPATEQVLGHFATIAFATGIEGLKVHGFPDWTGLNICGVEGSDEFIARAAEPFFVYKETTEPVGVETVGGLRHERDSREVGELAR